MKKYIIPVLFIAIICLAGRAFSQDANYYYYKANTALNSGKMQDAASLYNKVISVNKNFFEAYIGLSIAYREQGKYDKALESAQQALILKPDYYQAYYNMGLILEKQNRNEEAINAYEKFLKEVKGAAKFSDAKQRIAKLKEISN
jgi:tetratricopeptide (TPR) repeat protein